jgi:hypothetical protein
MTDNVSDDNNSRAAVHEETPRSKPRADRQGVVRVPDRVAGAAILTSVKRRRCPHLMSGSGGGSAPSPGANGNVDLLASTGCDAEMSPKAIACLTIFDMADQRKNGMSADRPTVNIAHSPSRMCAAAVERKGVPRSPRAPSYRFASVSWPYPHRSLRLHRNG